MRVHQLNNVSTAFRVLGKYGVKLVNISNDDIVDGNPKLTLGLVWSIILHWQVRPLNQSFASFTSFSMTCCFRIFTGPRLTESNDGRVTAVQLGQGTAYLVSECYKSKYHNILSIFYYNIQVLQIIVFGSLPRYCGVRHSQSPNH